MFEKCFRYTGIQGISPGMENQLEIKIDNENGHWEYTAVHEGYLGLYKVRWRQMENNENEFGTGFIGGFYWRRMHGAPKTS